MHCWPYPVVSGFLCRCHRHCWWCCPLQVAELITFLQFSVPTWFFADDFPFVNQHDFCFRHIDDKSHLLCLIFQSWRTGLHPRILDLSASLPKNRAEVLCHLQNPGHSTSCHRPMKCLCFLTMRSSKHNLLLFQKGVAKKHNPAWLPNNFGKLFLFLFLTWHMWIHCCLISLENSDHSDWITCK